MSPYGLRKKHFYFPWDYVCAGVGSMWHIFIKRNSIFSGVRHRYIDTCKLYIFINMYPCIMMYVLKSQQILGVGRAHAMRAPANLRQTLIKM